MKKMVSILLFSNCFYGIAALALAIESNMAMGFGLNHWYFYLVLFCSTVSFYTFSYQYDPHPLPGNKRASWISANKRPLIIFRNTLALFTFLTALLYLLSLPKLPFPTLLKYILMLSVAPLIGFLYYGVAFPGLFKIRLRSFGWFKPFIIGAVWAGSVSFMPWLLYYWEKQAEPVPNFSAFYFWLHNLMFISILAILFDIKDYAADHNHDLKTFVVRVGLRKVIYYIVLPLTLSGMMIMWGFMVYIKSTTFAMVLNTIPMLLLIWVTLGLHKRRPVAWYLLVIDGLMLVKAFCGILAWQWT